MAVKLFDSSAINPILKDNGLINAGGYIYFYEPDTAYATAKVVYSDKDLSVSLGSQVTLTSAATKTIFLNGNYDIKIFDSSVSLIRTIDDINPEATTTANESNLIANGSFEENTNNLPSDWTLFEWNASANVVDSTDQSHGTYSMKFVTAGSGGGYITTNSFFAVSPNQPIEVTFQLKSTADIRNIVQILWYDANQAAHGTPSTSIYDNSTTNPTSWTKMYAAAIPPAGAYWAKLRVIGGDSSDASSGTARFDGITVSIPTDQGEGTAVASAATTDIWGAGLVKHITGTTAITSFGTAPYAGAIRRVIFDGILTLTHGANLSIPGSANITTAAGDSCLVYADTTTQFDVLQYTKFSGMPIVAVNQNHVATAAIGQGQLKTTTASGSQGVGASSAASYTLTGGTYSWWTASSDATPATDNWVSWGNGDVGAGVIGLANRDATNTRTFYVDERYVQASPPYTHGPLFVQLVVTSGGTIEAIRVAPDPIWAYHGPTDITPQYFRNGRGYRKVKRLNGMPMHQALRDPATLLAWRRDEIQIEEVEQEITLAYKDSDMALVPHPFLGMNLTGRTIVMLEPGCRVIEKLALMHENLGPEGAREVRKLIENNYLDITNTTVTGTGLPTTITPVRVRWRLT